MSSYEVVNWQKFQHYTADRPAWIKNYVSLQDNIRYRRLPDAAKGHLHGLFLLAARTGNEIPDDPEQVGAMIGARSKVDFGILVSAGFLKPCTILHDPEESCTILQIEENRRDKKREEENREPSCAPKSGAPSVAEVRAVLKGCERVTGRALKLTDGRDRKIRARLREGYTVEQLVRAMENATADPFYRGDNDRGKRYDRPETVFKTAEAVEMHLESGSDPDARKRELAALIEAEGGRG